MKKLLTYEFKDKNNTHHRGETKTVTVKVPVDQVMINCLNLNQSLFLHHLDKHILRQLTK